MDVAPHGEAQSPEIRNHAETRSTLLLMASVASAKRQCGDTSRTVTQLEAAHSIAGVQRSRAIPTTRRKKLAIAKLAFLLSWLRWMAALLNSLCRGRGTRGRHVRKASLLYTLVNEGPAGPVSNEYGEVWELLQDYF
ncbi:unnamed protein product [Parajaminaea phylloscopi]